MEWIVVDGNSTEKGLQDYLRCLDFLDELVIRDCTHAEAMNTIVEKASGDYLLMIPEDIQFIVKGRWIFDLVDALKDPKYGSICIDAQRRSTLKRQLLDRYFQFKRWKISFKGERKINVIPGQFGYDLIECLQERDPICPSGIVSFTAMKHWENLGPWKTIKSGQALSNDSSLGAEEDMRERILKLSPRPIPLIMKYPVAADIITDPRGTKARIRKRNRRYGKYSPPLDGDFYYKIKEESELNSFKDYHPSPGFEDYVESIGFEIPLNVDGSLKKVSVIGDGEPYELVE